MFGLEGSGFVVCLGLILFLIGLVMFYVRQRFADQEAKLNQVISIIPVMTQQIQLHEQELHPNMFHKDTPSADSNPLGTIPEDQESKIDVSSSDESEDESESEPESDDEETMGAGNRFIWIGAGIELIKYAEVSLLPPACSYSIKYFLTSSGFCLE